MNALRHISTGLVALLVLVLGGVWLVPPWLDWNRYREDVAALATGVLGHDVRIEGAITLRLLPQPRLVAERVSVGGEGAGAGIKADQLLLRVALSPLLGGRVDARELVLRGADIRLPWPLEPDALVLRAPSWLSSLSARIEGGRLLLGEVEVTGLEATLATSDISGSFFSAGRARGGGRDWVFTARVSRPGGDGAVGVDVTLDGQGAAQGLGAVVSGQMQADGTLLGRIAVRGPDLSQLLPAPPVPFRTEGRLTSGGGLVAADELTGELAGAPVHGAVALRLTPRVRLDVAVTASRIDLDSWLPALRRGAEGGAFARLPVGIDLSAEAAPLAGGTLRAVRGAFDIEAGTVQVREARAVLPGDAPLRIEGAAAPDARTGMRFTGQAWLTAPALRSTLAWAAAAGLGPVDGAPAGALREADLAGRLALGAGEITLSDVTGQIDGTAVAASLTWRPHPRPTMQAVVVVDRLNLGDWLPGEWPGLQGAASAFGSLGLDLRLEATQAVWRGRELAKLSLDLGTEPGRIALRTLEVQGLGLALAASGALLEGGRLADARAELRAERGAEMVPMVAEAIGRDAASRVAPLFGRSVAVQVQGSGAPESLGLTLAGQLGDLRIEATPTVDLPARRWAGALTLRHPGAPRLAETMGLTGATAWLGDGSFGLVAQLAGGPERIVVEPFDLAAGSLRARGAVRLDHGAVPRLSGRIAAESLPLPLPFPRSPEPLPVDALVGWDMALELSAREVLLAQERMLQEAAANLTLSNGMLRLEAVRARSAGGAVSGALAFDGAARPPTLSVQANLTGVAVSGPVFDLPLDLAGGRYDGTVQLTAAGFAPAGLLASLDGRFALSGRDGVLVGIDLARMLPDLEEDALRAALAGGATAFEHLAMDGVLDRGGLTLARAALSGPAGTITASGTIDLIRALLALRLAVLPAVPDAPEIGLRLNGPAEAVVRVPELAGAVRWRAERK